ncbi:MAG: threonylcarbamoyl-AMP synthase [Candidatus Marinimicrobia bacterium]|mgnify:CR=1 FL=1|nr:threonylcarbamoyl-AMP synthase [Candidatus Neomarinimicrobiota bacterium]|tara:strand:- start:1803 stop:2399 length:597 start_codon:yes stop_codon:yes gene_type:complete
MAKKNIYKMKIFSNNSINHAADLIHKGEIIILPTDTLYGFSFDACNSNTIERFNKFKRRNNPISIIVDSIEMAREYAEIKDEDLFHSLLPGPFTCLYPKNVGTNLSDLVTNNSNLVGIRIPKHKLSISIVQKLQKPITTTSVNIHGEKPLETIEDIKNEFPYIKYFDEGHLISKGSTIINFSINPPKIIRQGDGNFKK